MSYLKQMVDNPFSIKKSAAKTTAILMPEMDTTEGIYRSILPSFVINNLIDNYRILIFGICQKMKISNNEHDFLITKEMINQTDHFVFPFVSYPLQPIIQSIKEIKNNVHFSYYIDFNYYTVMDSYPFANEYKVAKMVNVIENNIKEVDQVIVTNRALKDYIADKIIEKYPDEKFNTLITCQPLFIPTDIIKNYTLESNPKPDKIRVLIIGDEYQFSDFNFIKGVLKDFKTKYKEKIEIHIIGFDGKKGDKNYLQGLDFIHHDWVPYSKYFELIHSINPDCLLIPANDNLFNNTSKNYVKYLEFAILNIPVIATDIKPYSDLIKTNENGFLANKKEDYLFQLETLITSKEKFDAVLDFAYTTAFDYNIIADNNIEIIKQIYGFKE